MAYGNTNTVTTCLNAFTSKDDICYQEVILTHIIFSKKPAVLPEVLNQKRSAPVDKPISIVNLNLLYQTHDGSWSECQEVAIAPKARRNEEPDCVNDSVINIEPGKLISYSIRGGISIKRKVRADYEIQGRVHSSLPQPLKLKIVTTDAFGKQCSLIVEQLNEPLELVTKKSLNDSFAFVYVDDCDMQERVYMRMKLTDKNALYIGCTFMCHGNRSENYTDYGIQR